MRILLVEARFYADIADEMAAGALAVLQAAGAEVTRVAVPGALELPAAVAMARRGNAPFDGYVALGCVIRGETDHYDYVCREAMRGLMDVTLKDGLPLGNGLLTVQTAELAWSRARRREGDKGGAAARAALAMIALRRRFDGAAA